MAFYGHYMSLNKIFTDDNKREREKRETTSTSPSRFPSKVRLLYALLKTYHLKKIPPFWFHMKKIKRLVTDPPSNPFNQSFKDPRNALKHQSLLQDFAELLEETEENKKRLEIMKEKRLVLSAEVKFLRRRYKYLAESQSQNRLTTNCAQPQIPVPVSQNMERDKKSVSRQQASGPDSKQKGKMIFNATDFSLQAHHPSASEFNRRQKALGKEVPMINSGTVPELSQSERPSSLDVAIAHKVPPIFDLNEISREEEELLADGDEMIGNELMYSSVRGSIHEQLNEMKVSPCRKDARNGTSRTGKRKISWQDPVALRVGILSPLK